MNVNEPQLWLNNNTFYIMNVPEKQSALEQVIATPETTMGGANQRLNRKSNLLRNLAFGSLIVPAALFGLTACGGSKPETPSSTGAKPAVKESPKPVVKDGLPTTDTCNRDCQNRMREGS